MSSVTNGSPPANRDSTSPITMPDDSSVRSIGYGVVPCTNMFSTCWQSGVKKSAVVALWPGEGWPDETALVWGIQEKDFNIRMVASIR